MVLDRQSCRIRPFNKIEKLCTYLAVRPHFSEGKKGPVLHRYISTPQAIMDAKFFGYTAISGLYNLINRRKTLAPFHKRTAAGMP